MTRSLKARDWHDVAVPLAPITAAPRHLATWNACLRRSVCTSLCSWYLQPFITKHRFNVCANADVCAIKLDHQADVEGRVEARHAFHLEPVCIADAGYEEAAAQGLVAGMNAARLAAGRAPVALPRNSSYIGTLIDDLVTKDLREPYRSALNPPQPCKTS